MLVKICGVRDPGNAREVEAAGADWIGLNFHPPSPRSIDAETAARIAAALTRARAVAVCVDLPPRATLEILDRTGIGILQLHGSEPPEYLSEVAREGLTLVKAFQARDEASAVRIREYLARCRELGRAPDAVLVDAFAPGLRGGTGRSIPDAWFAGLPPRAELGRLILAGGLTPSNVAERVRFARPWMVDAAGGVEESPGWKRPELVEAFVAEARRGAAEAGRERERESEAGTTG